MSSILNEHRPNFGLYRGEIQSVDPRAFRNKNVSDLWLPTREKRWQYIGIYGEKVIAGIAVVHAGYIGSIFVYVYDRKSGLLWEQDRTAVMAAGIRVDRNVHTGVVSYMAEDERIRIDNDLDNHSRRLDVRLHNDGRLVDIRLEIKEDYDQTTPHQAVMPTPNNQFTFTHKSAGLPVMGSILIGDNRIEISPEDTLSAVDYNIGYYDYKTDWNWASMAGKTADGTPVGLNLTHPQNHEKYHENVLWLNGEPIMLGPADFSYSKPSDLSKWHIESKCGRAKLDFQPLGLRSQNINYGFVSSKFFQPFGLFSGVVKGASGQMQLLREQPGVVEEHFARW